MRCCWCERPLFLFVYQKEEEERKKAQEEGDKTMTVSLSVMTFNLHDDQPEESPNSWHKRKDLCLSVITSYSPIVLCTQQGSFLSSPGIFFSHMDQSMPVRSWFLLHFWWSNPWSWFLLHIDDLGIFWSTEEIWKWVLVSIEQGCDYLFYLLFPV